MDVIDFTGSEFGGQVRWGCPLGCGTIDWADPLGWRAHRAGGRGMLELLKGLGNVIRHGYVDVAMRVIPGNGEAKVRCTGPVNCDGVAGAERVDEVLRVLLINVFHPKVINNKGEGDGRSVVGPQGRGMLAGGISEFGKVCCELVVGKLAGLLKAWHALPNFNIDPIVASELKKVVLLLNFWRNEIQGKAHVLKLGHDCTVIVVFDVKSEVAGVGC